jgi:arabinose-5-phosphate isomerase
MSEPMIESGRKVFERTVEELASVGKRLGLEFTAAAAAIAGCEGRIVVTGIGKSGHVGRKIASTFSSTGTPAVFIHATEAMHGDLGFIRREDVVILISKSGGNEELRTWMPFLLDRGCITIAITGNAQAYLAREASILLDASVDEEACPNNLAPTTSSTAALVMGDALAVAVLEYRGFSPEDFLRLHPGGILGKRLSLRVRDLMHPMDSLAHLSPKASLREAIGVLIDSGLGMACVLEDDGLLSGLLTDGDLKRALVMGETQDLMEAPVSRFATADPRTVAADTLASEALTLMETNQPGPITGLVVRGPLDEVLGLLHIHDILRAGLSSSS